ncbi:MAG: hypothetical protein Q8L34_03315, partial [Candidatus Woesearchaeota archaeon]|nr:hypothetical protein [Candidatus Woesearchaeota archaeon]
IMTNLEDRFREWEARGRKKEEITWGMLNDGFQSIQGIPDDFYSAEDPADRVNLWHKYRMENNESYRREQCHLEGRCWRCGRADCGCD